MANSKSEQHVIPLNDPDLNTSRYDSDVSNWVGFNDRNSPYLSGECLPLYTKTINNTNTWVSPTMDEYSITNNVLYKNGSLLQGFTTGLEWKEFSPTFTYEGNTYTGIVLGGYKHIYGIYYNAKIYIYKHGAGIVGVSDVSNYEEAATWFCVAHAQTYNSADLYAWFSGPYPTVSLIPYHVLSGSSSALTPNTNRTRYTLKSETAIEMKPGYEGRIVTTISKLHSGTRNERYEGSYLYPPIDSNVKGIVFSAGAYTKYMKVFSAPADNLNDTIPYTNWQTRYVFLNNTNSIGTTYTDPSANCMAMEGNLINRGDSDASAPVKSPAKIDTVGAYFYWESGGILGRHYGYINTSVVTGFSDLYSSTNGSKTFTETDTVATRHLAMSPLRSKSDTNSITGNFSWISCTEGRYSTDVGDVNGISQFGQEYHQDITILGNTLSMRLLYIGGNLSTCSIGVGEYRGSLLMPWNSISDAFVDEYSICIQKRIDKKWYYLDFTLPVTFEVYKNRYMIFNVPDFLNCLDTKENKWYHVADDWNNRFTWGDTSDPSASNIYWIASGVASLYNSTNYPFPGYQSGVVQHKILGSFPNILIPSNLTYGALFTTTPIQTDNSIITTMDIYKSKAITAGDENSSDTTPTYLISVSDKIQTLDYVGILWTTENNNILLNPPLFTEYKPGLITIANMDGYSAPLLTENMTEAAIYYGLAQAEGSLIIFCIQSMFYEISDNFLYSIDMIDGIVSNPRKIVDLTELMFIANNQMAAYFWSPNNKTIYMFTGDAILKPMKGCSKIGEVYNTYYKTDTQEIFLMTDVGTYVSTNEYMYRVPGVWDSAFSLDYGYGLRSSTNGVKLITYYKDIYHTVLEPAVLETKMYGAGNNIITNTDCVYIRLFRGDLGDEPATVNISGFTLTDIATPLHQTYQTFTITKTDWDTKDNSYYIRYQPTYQKSIGMSIRIESTAPITYVGFGTKVETLQITK